MSSWLCEAPSFSGADSQIGQAQVLSDRAWPICFVLIKGGGAHTHNESCPWQAFVVSVSSSSLYQNKNKPLYEVEQWYRPSHGAPW